MAKKLFNPAYSCSIRIGKLSLILNIFFLTGLVFLGLGGCGSAEKDLAKNPKLLWEIAQKSYGEGDTLEARKYYERFIQYFPQDERVSQAKLRVADTYFDESKYFEAEVHYESFIELHPAHEEVSYAWYRLGLSQMQQVPGTIARDQHKAVDAQKSFARFLALPSKDENLRELAQDNVRELDIKLMSKEFEIGSWYYKLGHYQSAYKRFKYLLNKFTHLRTVQEDRLYLAAQRLVYSAIELEEKGRIQEAKYLFEMFKDHDTYGDIVRKIDKQLSE